MTEPSKVLHIRNVGPEMSEADLYKLVETLGTVTKLVILRAKNQALMQMRDIPSAVSVLEHYSTIQPSIRGRNVYIQFSSHQELTTAEYSGQARRSGDQDSQPNRILLVTIHHLLYPITVEVLHQVFSPLGFVKKIVIFQKSGLQAFIQYSSRQSAIQAMKNLQEQGDLKLRVRTLESERAFKRVAAAQKTIVNAVLAGTLVNLATILHINSIRLPAIAAYFGSAIFFLQVLIGVLQVRNLDQQERLITGTA